MPVTADHPYSGAKKAMPPEQLSSATRSFHELVDCVQNIGDKPDPVSLGR